MVLPIEPRVVQRAFSRLVPACAILLLLALVVTLLVLATCLTFQARALSAEPEGIRLYLPPGADPSTQVGVIWTTDNGTLDSQVDYGLDTGLGLSAAGTSFHLSNSTWQGRLHRVELTNLTPSATYHYRVGDGSGNSSGILSFTTLPDPGEPASLTLGLFGSMGLGTGAEAVAQALTGADLDALIALGGLALAPGDDHSAWDEWARLASNFSRQTLLFPGAGGDDLSGPGSADGWALERVPPLNQATWYEARLGRIQLVVLDGSADLSPGSAQYDWLEARLTQGWEEATVNWRLITLHQPLYSSGGANGSNATLQGYLEPLLSRFPGTLLIASADNHYQRSRPLENGSVMESASNGTVHLVVGHGGQGLGRLEEPSPSWSMMADNESLGYLRLTLHVNGTLEGRALTDQGQVRDSFWFELPDPGFHDVAAPAYVVQGEPVQLNGSANRTGFQFRWVSDLEGTVLEEATGQAWLGNGTHRLALRGHWPDSSWSAALTFNLTVNGRPRARILTAPTLVQEGAPAYLAGQGADDGELAGYEWRSALEGLLSIAPSFTTSNLSNGTHNLSFWVLDQHWEWSAPASVRVRVNGQPVVTRPTPGATQMLRGGSITVTFSGYDDATAGTNLTPALAYRDPDGFLKTEYLGPLTRNASAGTWEAAFNPPYSALHGDYTFLAHLSDDEGGSSGWRPGPVLNVLNNRPETLFLGGDDRWLLPGQAVMVWAEGVDLEDEASTLGPALQFALTGSGEWTPASSQNWAWNFSRRVHELWFTPPWDIMPAVYDLRVSHDDSDGGASDWVALAGAVRVLEVHLGSLNPSVHRTGTVTLWSNLSHLPCDDLEIVFVHRPLAGGAWANDSQSDLRYDGALAAWRVDFTPPATAALGPYQFAVTFHNASANLTSNPIIELPLEVLNNPPGVVELDAVGGPLAMVQRETSLVLWANGTDIEDALASMVPTFQYRLNGSDDNWTEAGIGVASFSGPDQRWEAAFTPNATAQLGPCDLRVRLKDTEDGLSDWLIMGSPFQVVNRPPVILNLSVDRLSIFRNGTLNLTVQVDDEGPALLNASFEVRHQDEVEWLSEWFGPPGFQDGLWQANLSPPPTAGLGAYSARVAVTDPDGGTSPWFVVEGLFKLNNTPPCLEGLTVHDATPLRNSQIPMTVRVRDYETPSLSLVTRLEYRPHGSNATWVPASVTVLGQVSGGYNVSWPLPAQAALDNYSVRVEVTDGDGSPSGWWESDGPAFAALNNPPEVLNVTVNRTLVNRGQEALFQIQTRDRDHPSGQLQVELTIGASVSGPFIPQWLGQPVWNPQAGGLWQVLFSPPSTAPTGNYSLQVVLTDPDNGTSVPFILGSAIEVGNNPPRVTNFTLDMDEILRGETLTLRLDGHDLESLPLEMHPQFGYFDGAMIRPLPWSVYVLGSDHGSPGRGEYLDSRHQVAVPYSADLGGMELFARLVDDEGGVSGWWGPVNLSVRNNAPRLNGVNLTQVVIRTQEVTLWVNASDLETPESALGLTLRLTPENGSSASYYPLREVTFLPANRTHRATFPVSASWPLGHYRVNLTLEDGEGGRDWTNVTLPFQVLNRPPELLRVSVEQHLGDLLFSAEGEDRDGEVAEYRWSLKNSSLLGRQGEFSLKAYNVGGGNRTFVVVAVDNDGGLSEPREITLKVDAPSIGANANKPWITARLVGFIIVAGLLTMVVGGATARAHNATLRELAQMPPYLVEEAFLVSWEGRPVAHTTRDAGSGGGQVNPALAREVLDSAREMAGARPGQVAYLGPWQLELGPTMFLITGHRHFLALICQGRPPQAIWEVAEELLRGFEGRTVLVDGEPVKISPEDRATLTGELATLVDPTRAILPKQMKARLALRQVELDTSLIARRGRLLWQVKVVNNSRFDLNRCVIHLEWDGELARGPAVNRLDLPRVAHSCTETFLFPLEPRAQGQGRCSGRFGYHIPGRWELMELEPRTLRTDLPSLTIISDTARAHRLLEGERGDRITIEYPLPELIKGELVAQRARSALHHLGLRPLPELILEPDPTGPAIMEDSVWGGQDVHGEQLVAWLSLRDTTLGVELVAERPLTLVQGVAAFREGFKEKLGEIYGLLEGV